MCAPRRYEHTQWKTSESSRPRYVDQAVLPNWVVIKPPLSHIASGAEPTQPLARTHGLKKAGIGFPVRNVRPGLLERETGTRKFVTRVQVMLNSAAIARPSRVSEMYRDPCC